MKMGFDTVASGYDSEFTDTAIGVAQRNRVWYYVSKAGIGRLKKILETNCGTGFDALRFIQEGHYVVYSDNSAEMLQMANSKIKGIANNTAESLIWDLKNPYPGKEKEYDLIFSNFGGWNCLSPDDMLKFAEQCDHLLQPNGKIIAVIMGRKCLWEKWYFLYKGNKKQASRRKNRSAVKAQLAKNVFVETWYYSPDEMRNFFVDFNVKHIKPIGLFIPPSYLQKYFNNKKWLLNMLIGLESVLSFSFLSNYADHYYIELEKNPSGQ